jgi:predicted nucleotidyltransferase
VPRPILADLDELKRRMAPHVQRAIKVIVFGSVARGESYPWSDLDLIIVAETDRPFLERFKDFAGLYDVWSSLDLLIYTPAEFDRMVADENPLVMQALREGVLLHPAA